METQLFRGDCLDLLKEVEDSSIDMILCDPPYGTTDNAWDSALDSALLWEELKRVRKAGAAIALFSQLPFSLDLIEPNRKEFRYEIIWHKVTPVGFLNAYRMPLRIHENILVFYDKLPIFNPQKTKGDPYTKCAKDGVNTTNYRTAGGTEAKINLGDRFPTDVLRIGTDVGKFHPTQKPVALLANLIKTYTNEGMTVLDFTMGSGSTGVACVKTNRNFVGIERDPHFFRIAKQRVLQVKANHALQEDTLQDIDMGD